MNGDTSAVVSGTASLATTATVASAVGTYPITFAVESLTAPSYYNLTYVSGTLVVYNTSLPLALWLSSNSAAPGGAGFTLTVNGANFAASSVVLWNGAVRTTSYVSSTQLTAEILPADIAQEKTNLVTVANLTPNPGTSSALPFAVMSNAPVAAISGGAISTAADGSGNHALTLLGTNFVSNSNVVWNGASLMTTYVSPWQISAVVTASNFTIQPVTVKVENPAGVSAGLELNTISTPIVVAISPEAASVQTGATQQFTAAVTGSASTAVTWSVNGAGGGDSAVGTISSGGLYTAPASVSAPSTFTVTATSVADPNETASASVVVATAIYDLTLSATGSGSGTITSNPAGTSCGTNCYAYVPGTVVQVTESASAGSMFGAWGGACANKSTCAVTMNSSQSVTVTFNRIYNLTLNMAGTGSGTITPSPVGISCGTDCYAYVSGTVVQLTASSNTGSTFVGWSGACTGTGSCNVTMSSNQTVAATFNQTSNLTLSVTGSGSGTVTPSPTGTSCGTNCHAYASGTVVHVTESANAGSTFAGWGGACSGTGSCSVTMNSSLSATATFNLTGSGGNQVWILDFGPDPVVGWTGGTSAGTGNRVYE